MKFTIVTPSFNQAAYLPEAIDSVRNQRGVEIEYFVVDGGSSDGSGEIISRNADCIDWWVSEPDNGQSHAINKGLQRATGDVVAWLNSDDRYTPAALQEVARTFERHPEVDLVYCNVRNFSRSKATIHKHLSHYAPEDFYTRTCLHQPGVFWRRTLMERTGLLNPALHYVMDFDLWIRMALNGKLKLHKFVAAEFRLHEAAKTHADPVEMYIEKNTVVRDLFYNHDKLQLLDSLKELSLYPADPVQQYSVKYPLGTTALHAIFSRHIVNNAYLSYRLGQFARSRTLLQFLSERRLPVPARVRLLRAKLRWQRLKGK